MKIGIVGAGCVGAGFGAFLAQHGHEVVAMARGSHLEAIRRDGLTVSRAGERHVLRITASDKADDLGSVDLVLFAVKLWDTAEAGRQAKRLLGPETPVLVLQNGVDALDVLEPILGRERLIGGVAQISAVIEAPGVVAHRSPFARIIAGELSGENTQRLQDLVGVLSAAGIEARGSGEIIVELWNKFVFIVGLSGATGLFRSSIGPIRDDPETRRFLEDLVAEATAVGRALGVSLPADQAERTMSFVAGLPEAMRASMLEDLLAGRRLELPWLSGYVVRKGREHGVPTPANEMVELALKLHVMGA
jgi:2-dehydropantoate 2-reductase